MADIHLDFVPPFADHDADLVVMLEDSTVARIRHLSLSAIRDACPLLFHAFEEGINIPYQASIEVTSLDVVAAFLRFLYTGDYLASGDEANDCSLLLHAEVCKMAEDYQVPELQVSAYVNFMQAMELSCSFPMPPVGLCEAVRFVYAHLACDPARQQQSLVDALLNYCVSSFKYHGLGDNAHFRQVVYDNPTFHKHLCETSMARGFPDDGAAEIICLPVCSPQPHSRYDVLNLDTADFHFDLFCADDTAQGARKRDNATLDAWNEPAMEEGPTLELRPRHAQSRVVHSENESSSEDEGFALVHRPRLAIHNPFVGYRPTEDVPSSPELVSATVSDDEWSYEAITATDITPLLQDPTLSTPRAVFSTPEDAADIPTDDEWSLV